MQTVTTRFPAPGTPGRAGRANGVRRMAAVCRSVPAVLALLLLLVGTCEALTVEVTVDGIAGEQLSAVLSNLSIDRQKDHPYLNEALIRRLHAQAPGEITRSLEPFGFYRATVDPRLEGSEKGFTAAYTVSPGDPVVVSRLDVRYQGPGASHRVLAETLEKFPLRKGDVLVHKVYESGKKSLLTSAVWNGYLDAAAAVHNVKVKVAEGTAEVFLTVETGPRYLFGPVSFQQEILSERYLKGYVTIREGDPYDQGVLMDLQEALYDSGQFRVVEVAVSRGEPEDLRVPVRIRLEPAPPRRFTIGVGYGTDTGPRFRTGWEDRRVNREAHRIRGDLLVSPVLSRMFGQYVIPLRRPRTDYLDLTATLARERIEDIDSDSALLGVSYNRLRGRTRISEFIRYLWENFDVASDEGRTAAFIPGVGLSHVRADNRMETRRGFRLDLEVQGSDKDVLSRFSFLQARLLTKGILPVGSRGRIILRGEAGSTWMEQFEALPPTLRFFAGGDQSVRGFAYKSLGPVDASGKVLGGSHLLVGSLEYEHRIGEKWSLALFRDIGNALEDLDDPLEEGVGAGVRWRSVVGLIRFDVAWAVSRADNPWRIHLNIGPDL